MLITINYIKPLLKASLILSKRYAEGTYYLLSNNEATYYLSEVSATFLGIFIYI